MKQEIAVFQQAREKVRGFILRACLDQVVFWGKPEWVESLARRLSLTDEHKKLVLSQAHLSAGLRAEIIHGDYTEQRKHFAAVEELTRPS